VIAALTLVLGAAGANPAWPPPDPQTPAEALAHPENMPDDPDYRPHADPESGCGGQLELYSFTPECTSHIARAEREVLPGSGIAVDRAWLWTTGRPDVLIAVADSGIDWTDRELVLRISLNPGELPKPETSSRAAGAHDTNGDGIFNVQDYSTATGTVVPTRAMISDRRLRARADGGDSNGNGILDPEDLIVAFSNGADEDGDGFIDDIAGWDFIDGDNDPGDPDPVRDGHGTRQARAIAATANNGIGGAGACPSCMLFVVRTSARGAASGSALASAILFSVGRGAKVIAASTFAAGGSRFVKSASAFALQSGVLIVAPAGEGSSLRGEVQWDPDKVLIVGGIGYGDVRRDRATSAVAPDPCSNFGPQLWVSAPSPCSDSNAAIVAGAAGLLFSAAGGIPSKSVAKLDPPLTAREALEVIAESADDVPRLFPEDASSAPWISAMPAPAPGVLVPLYVAQGWDERTGYGRTDARRAIDAIIQRRIPAEVEILSPDWLAVIDPSGVSGFDVMGRVTNKRADEVSWVLDFAVGASPNADAFTPIASGMVARGESAEVAGTLPTDALFRDPTADLEAPNAFAITLRLSASTALGSATVRGETRRVVYVHRDLETLPAFPIALGAAVTASPRLIDLDGDGKDEILVATDDGAIHAFDGRGRPLTGWPVHAPLDPLIDPMSPSSHRASSAFSGRQVPADTGAAILGAIAAIGPERGKQEKGLVVAATAERQLLAFDATGAALDGFPLTLPPTSTLTRAHHASAPLGLTQAPVIVDLDGDGRLDIALATQEGAIHALDLAGQELAGYPVVLSEKTGSPAVGDLDGDRRPDLVAASDQTIFLLFASGARSEIRLPKRAFEPRPEPPLVEPTPALGDLDGDGIPEIAIATRGRAVLVYKASSTAPFRTVDTERARIGLRSDGLMNGAMIFGASGTAALADLDGDGELEVATAVSSMDALLGLDVESSVERLFATWSLATGTFSDGAPHLIADPAPAGCAIADLDGDRLAEVIVADGDGRVDAFALDGRRPQRWPKLAGGWVQGAPALGDLAGNGQIDVVVATRSGLVFAWRTTGLVKGSLPWAGFAHDATASGNIATPTAVFTHVGLGSRCSCRGADGGRDRAPSAAISLAIIAFLAVRRAVRRPSPGGRTRSQARTIRATPSSRAR
jgi:subtilase family protein/VCBS repeat protein